MERNEGKVCDAVVRVLERRERRQRTDVVRPDAPGRASQVDFQVRLGAKVYAIEHTQIEAYENQVRSDRRFTDLIGPVKARLSGTLPGDAVYDLEFPVETGLGKKSSDLSRAQEDLVQWVRAKAAALDLRAIAISTDEESFGPLHHSVSEKSLGFPYKVTLRRRRRSHRTHGAPGSLHVARVAPDDLAGPRLERLRRALKEKCPKLDRCKAAGARTVLVLESTDLSLSNSVDIRETLVSVLAERDDAPDEVYLVETVSTAWFVYPLAVDGVYCPIGFADIPDFSSDDLVDLRAVASPPSASLQPS